MQFVSINNAQSGMKSVIHGVPQGSVLGPLLFLLYINDLHECIHNSETFHFADDTHLLHILKKHNGRYKLRKLLVDLKSLTHWLLANKISLNVAKTELIYFRRPSVEKPCQVVKINGVKIQPVDKVKYLGLTLDEFLTWNAHRNILLAKLRRGNNLISIIRHYAPKPIVHQVYYGQFHSHITYACQSWGLSLPSNSPIITAQKKAVRLMTFSPHLEHTDPIFKELKILKINNVIQMQDIILAHKVITTHHLHCMATLIWFR